jgi:hypothetical protein
MLLGFNRYNPPIAKIILLHITDVLIMYGFFTIKYRSGSHVIPF